MLLILSPPFMLCVTLVKFDSVSEPQFPVTVNFSKVASL